MRFIIVSLIVISGLGVSTAEAPPWTDEPRIVTLLDMEAEFQELPDTEIREVKGKRFSNWWEGVLYLKLCARATGETGTDNYRHAVHISIEKKATENDGCRNYRVDYKAREGSYPEYHLNLSRSGRRIPARRIYLLSDDFRWFLYFSGSSPGDIFEYHDAEVIRLELWDESAAGHAPLSVGFSTKCRGHVADHASDCYDCHLLERQGRSHEGFRDSYDGIFRCIREKLLDSGPQIIHWSKSNSQCFIDYSMCVK